MERYSARLLFQYRFDGEAPNSFRQVEERLLSIRAKNAKQALAEFKARGKRDARHFKNSEGQVVRFEFVGVMEMIHLGIEADEDEYWYSTHRMKSPMERRDTLIPKEHELSAVRYEAAGKA